MGKNNAVLPDVETLERFGIDPRTVYKANQLGKSDKEIKNNVKRMLRIMDEEEAIHRYTWDGLPEEIDPELLERTLYYHGQGMLFYMAANEQFYFLPYTLSGSIDVYARYTQVTPLPFNGGVDSDGKQHPWILGLKREPVYRIKKEGDDDEEKAKNNKCVLLKDYTEQRSEYVIPRQIVNDGYLDVMANCIPYCNTAMICSCGVKGMKVGTSGEQSNVAAANFVMKKAAVEGDSFVAITGDTVEWQLLNEGNPEKPQEFLQTFQGLYNFKMQSMGIDNGGVFEKKSHMLESEQELESGTSNKILLDGLKYRQKFAERANSWLGTNISVEINEEARESKFQISEGASTVTNFMGGQSSEGQSDEE